MKDQEVIVNELIDEFRRRISQLIYFPNDESESLVACATIAEWLFMIDEFESAFSYLDQLIIQQQLISKELEQQDGYKQNSVVTELEAYSFLKQLLILHEASDWKWQLEQWQEFFGKYFYISRFYIFSNFLYDFFVLQRNEEIDKLKLEQLRIKNIPFQYKSLHELNKTYQLSAGEYGYVKFEPEKSPSKDKTSDTIFKVGKIVELLTRPGNSVSFRELKQEISNFSTNDYHRYQILLNAKFEKAIENRTIKILLVLKKKKGRTKNSQSLLLMAYPLSAKIN